MVHEIFVEHHDDVKQTLAKTLLSTGKGVFGLGTDNQTIVDVVNKEVKELGVSLSCPKWAAGMGYFLGDTSTELQIIDPETGGVLYEIPREGEIIGAYKQGTDLFTIVNHESARFLPNVLVVNQHTATQGTKEKFRHQYSAAVPKIVVSETNCFFQDPALAQTWYDTQNNTIVDIRTSNQITPIANSNYVQVEVEDGKFEVYDLETGGKVDDLNFAPEWQATFPTGSAWFLGYANLQTRVQSRFSSTQPTEQQKKLAQKMQTTSAYQDVPLLHLVAYNRQTKEMESLPVGKRIAQLAKNQQTKGSHPGGYLVNTGSAIIQMTRAGLSAWSPQEAQGTGFEFVNAQHLGNITTKIIALTNTRRIFYQDGYGGTLATKEQTEISYTRGGIMLRANGEIYIPTNKTATQFAVVRFAD